ncbi:MAG: DNA polymerase I [Acholeplasmatales bacterium]|nr:DNA polymerase I [Acholeplasmatales bacterium]
MQENNNVYLIDGSSFMYKAYFALAVVGNFMKNSKGLCTNAIYTFINMMTSILKNNPKKILVAFDAGKHTFRHDLVETYKDGRRPMDDEMRMQIPYIKKYLDLIGVARYELPLYEADDIIGTMAKKAEEAGYRVNVYSSDKDLLQLITDNITVFKSKKGINDLEEFNKAHFIETYGFDPIKMIDLKALMGDPSDNLPGIKGIGEKTATKLIIEYGSIEGIIENKDSLKGKMGDLIRENYNDAITTKKMVTINNESPIEITLDDINRKEENEELMDFYKDLEFNSFLKRTKVTKTINNLDYKVNDKTNAFITDSSIYLEMLDENYHNGKIIGIAIVNKNGNFYFDESITLDLDFKRFMEDESIKKYTYNYKRLKVSLMYKNINVKGVEFDIQLASYLINPKSVKDDFSKMVSFYEKEIELDEQIYGKGAKQSLPEESIYQNFIIKKANIILELKDKIINILKEQDQYDLFYNIELPLSTCLGDMEFSGMKVDLDELHKQKEDIKKRIDLITKDIYEVAGEEFNISSTKQLGVILFEKLNLPNGKKTKTGYSTDSDTLESIRYYHELPSLVLEYRRLTKLYSTYLEGIENVVTNGFVHTIFLQTQTETGRLSSIEPNLQNLPIRSEEGALIRKMFIPSNDLFVSMDYSQIELRLLAHIADVKEMISDFNNKKDIHEETAKYILKKDSVTKYERQSAKAINFGIIYGMSTWRLANDLKISNNEAKEFMDKYFERYKEIKTYMEEVVNFAKENGYVKTIMNRRRFIPELSNPVYMVREAGKRNAMNAPIQGSAADLMKLAMVLIHKELIKQNLKSKLVSQIHDELIFDVEKSEVDKVKKIGKEIMENAFKLKVPLEVSVVQGKTLFEAK